MKKNHLESDNNSESVDNESESSLYQHLSKIDFEQQAKEFALQQGFAVEDREDAVGLSIVSDEDALKKHQEQLQEKRKYWEKKSKGNTRE